MLEHVKNLKYLLFYFLMSCFLQYLCVLTFEIRTLECRTNFYSFLLQGWTVPVAGSLWPAHTEHDLWPGQRELPLHGQILWQRDPAPHQEDQPDRPAEALAASRAAGQPGRHRGPARQPDLLQHRRLTTPSGQYCTLIEKRFVDGVEWKSYRYIINLSTIYVCLNFTFTPHQHIVMYISVFDDFFLTVQTAIQFPLCIASGFAFCLNLRNLIRIQMSWILICSLGSLRIRIHQMDSQSWHF